MAQGTSRQQETLEAALVRLANKARAEGVTLQRNNGTGQFYATSGTVAGKRYEVSAYACACQGNQRHGYCKHMAAVASALGLITRPEDTPAAPAACRHCDGRGYWITARKVGRGQYVREDVPCPHCQGDDRAVDIRKVA